MSRLERSVSMKRVTLLLVLAFVSLAIVSSHAVYADEPAPLVLSKECVIIGRILGTDIMLYPTDHSAETDRPIPSMVRIKDFEILNTINGDWIPLKVSSDGYFCVNVRMGEYEFLGRDSENRPFLIHRFNVPLNMAVNLGTFWVETSHPKWVTIDPLHNYDTKFSWREYREGAGHVAMRVEHVTSREAYEDCESWFAGCHEEAYKHFEQVMARR